MACAGSASEPPARLGGEGYVEYVAGDGPIIVSAPHGGDLAPSAVRDRTAATCSADDDFSATNDANTQALARLVADSLAAATGKRTPLVIARLARRKLDANRDSLAAACGDAIAGRAWHEYQGFLDSARAGVARRWARGFYVDLHGHAHAIARIELGYLLRGSDLDRADATLDATSTFEMGSSIRTLSEASPLSFTALLRGPSSLGALLDAAGYPAVPSPAAPGPAGAVLQRRLRHAPPRVPVRGRRVWRAGGAAVRGSSRYGRIAAAVRWCAGPRAGDVRAAASRALALGRGVRPGRYWLLERREGST